MESDARDGEPTLSPSVPDVQAEATAFFLSVLEHLGEVIGEKAVEALVRFAAVEAATEAASQETLPLARLAEHYAVALGWEITILQATPKGVLARVRCAPGTARPAERAVAQGLVHGLFLGATRSRAAESRTEDEPNGALRILVSRTM